MGLVSTSVLIGIADRAATQVELIETALEDCMVTGGGTYVERVTATDNPDLEIPTEGEYEIVDDDFQLCMALKFGTQLSRIVTAMLAHFNRKDDNGQPLQTGGWDGYCQDKDIRMSWYFNQLFFCTQGFYMLANDVFSESDDVFGTVEVVAGPGLSFTNGVNYGNGSINNPANGTFYAATQLKIVVTSMGGTDLDLRLSVKDINDLPTTIDVTVPGGSIAGAEIPVGTSSDRFLDVTGVSFVPFGSFGTLGDDVTIQNLKERQISL
jgi:hypothetical protein